MPLVLTWILLIGAAWGQPPADDARPQRLTEGKPLWMGTRLPVTSYLEFEARRLAHARVLWVNYDLLREMGIAVPAAGIADSRFHEDLLDAFAYAVPRPDDPPGTFTDKVKKFFADRYGSYGVAGNYGSGRAGSAGAAQIKGIGQSPAVGASAPSHHRSGTTQIPETMRDALWGEMTSRENPRGGNRMFAILDSGTYYQDPSGDLHFRSIGPRQDPLRPAHFLPNQSAARDIPENEAARMAAIVPRIPEIWPGIHPFIDCLAEVYAAAYSRGMYHGATSPSNILADCGSIDFGTQAVQNGFTQFHEISDESPFGKLKSQDDLVAELVEQLGVILPPELKSKLPSVPDALKEFHRAYRDHLELQMIRRTGVPPELIRAMQGSRESRALSTALIQVASSGNTKNFRWKETVPPNTGRYDLEAVLNALAESPADPAPVLSGRLTQKIGNTALRERLAKAYSAYLAQLAPRAVAEGISAEHLATYVREAAALANRPMSGLTWNNWVLSIPDWNGDQGPARMQQFIDRLVDENTRTWKDAAPFEAVLSERRDTAQGVSVRQVYDARAGEHATIVRVRTSAGQGHFGGKTYSSEQLARATLGDRDAVVRGDRVEFRLPATSVDEAMGLKLRLKPARRPRAVHGCETRTSLEGVLPVLPE